MDASYEKHINECIEDGLPILFKVGLLGENYQAWLHKGYTKKKIRFFKSDFLEMFTYTAWWAIPFVWLPIVYMMLTRFVDSTDLVVEKPFLFTTGILLWPFLEYYLHRYAFHAQTQSYWANTIHFLFHGIHHKCPTDESRLVFPPLGTMFIATCIHTFISSIIGTRRSYIVMAGLISGYVIYDMIHYSLHHYKLKALTDLRKHHQRHHYQNVQKNFGISNWLLDRIMSSYSK